MDKILKVPKVNGQPLNVTLVKGDKWSSTKAIDFVGANVWFSGQSISNSPYNGNKNIVSIVNGNLKTTGCSYMLKGCTSLQTFSLNMDTVKWCDCMFYSCSGLTSFNGALSNAERMQYAFFGCFNLTSFRQDCPKVTKCDYTFYQCSSLTECISDMPNLTSIGSMFRDCTSLRDVQITVNATLSSKTWDDFSSFEGFTTTAPCQAYRYVDDLGDGTVRLVFTDTERVMVNNQLTMTDGSTYSCTGSSSISVSAQDNGIYHVTIINNTSGDIVLTGDSGVGATITLHQHERWVGNISMIYNGGMDGWIISSYTPDA